jgi:hypothetical protein
MFKLSCLLPLVSALLACSSPRSSDNQTSETLNAVNSNITLTQNTSASVDLKAARATGAQVTQAPAHGTVSFLGTLATYRPADPTYHGTDSFKYKLINASTVSNEAEVSVTITPLTSGSYTFTENYAGHAYALTGWKQYTSDFGHTMNSVAQFSTTTYNSVSSDSRRFGIYGDSNGYLGDSFYTRVFGGIPVDGAGGAMHDFPWKAELVHLPECGVDATVTLKLTANGGQYPMAAILLNYDIDRRVSFSASSPFPLMTLNGYQLLINSGGGSLTLSRFEHADQTATAYLDRWPNTNYGNENMTNPVTSGPYKGWNYRNGVWPAGGNVGTPTQFLVAVRYQYDPATKNTVISYESRHVDGTDDTPGTWDVAVTLTGADSLPPGGSFGLMAMDWHAASSLNTTDFDISEYKVQCNLP